MHLGTLKPFLFTWSSSSPPPRPAAAAWPGQGCFDQWPDTGIISTSAACCCWPELWLPGAGGQGDHPGVRAHDGWGGGQIQDKISSLWSCGRTTTICQQMQCISPPPNCFGPAALQQSPWFLALTFIPLMCVFTQKMIISLSPDCYNTQRHSSVCRPLLSRHSVLPNIYCTVWNKVIWICLFIFPVYIGSEDELVCPQSSPARAHDEVVMNAWQ